MGGGSHQASPNGARWKNSLAKLTIDKQDERKEVRDGIMGKGQSLSAEDESRINESTLGLNDGRDGVVTQSTLHSGLQQQQQQLLPPGPVVRWEMILPVRTLKVLLVECDDSTRQVVSALLRNCSYEVISADNGLQAWKILKNPTNHIDLILTEIAMPGLNGINLLSKVMSSDTLRNIPVIMMSSNDSMDTVFKCLSRGAVDFLVKPIRKNELKNLWQHVWRRSHSSSGSVSESGIQTQKSVKSKGVNDPDNNSSRDEEEDASISLNTRDGSDNGSGNQSSWTKHAVEVDSNKWLSMTANRGFQEQKKHADELMGKDLEIGVPRNSQSDNDRKNVNVLFGLESGSGFDEPSDNAADLIGGFANNTDALIVNDVTEPGTNDKNSDGSMELPSLQLSLKRLRSTGEVGNATHEDRNILRRSHQSAFSRYRTSASTQAPIGCVGSCSPVDNNSEAVKTESTQNMVSKDSNGNSDDNDKGSTTNPIAYRVALKGIHPSAFHPVHVQSSPHQVTKVYQEKIDGMESTVLVKCQYQVQQPLEHCGSSNVFGGKVEGNAANYSLNGSNSGSNHGSNAHNGSGANIESANGVAEDCGGGGGRNGSGSGSGSGVDQNRIAQREAALMKFRQKRKERNFGKKVRYQGRKRLAEQRPRVRGQFVRQPVQEPKYRKGDS